MSFVITMYVREGIVMASDSRLTLHQTEVKNEKERVQRLFGLSDSNYKTFLALEKVGISTFGAADINGVPIAGYIESFIQQQADNEKTDINDVTNGLLDYFGKFEKPPNTYFIVAGYSNDGEQKIWTVDIAQKKTNLVNENIKLGVRWGGESDIVTRLINQVALPEDNGEIIKLPHFSILYSYFTLQDAIDFCTFAIRSTIDAIRFQARPKTVGGPIDILVIKPNESFWVQRKALHP